MLPQRTAAPSSVYYSILSCRVVSLSKEESYSYAIIYLRSTSGSEDRAANSKNHLLFVFSSSPRISISLSDDLISLFAAAGTSLTSITLNAIGCGLANESSDSQVHLVHERGRRHGRFARAHALQVSVYIHRLVRSEDIGDTEAIGTYVMGECDVNGSRYRRRDGGMRDGTLVVAETAETGVQDRKKRDRSRALRFWIVAPRETLGQFPRKNIDPYARVDAIATLSSYFVEKLLCRRGIH